MNETVTGVPAARLSVCAISGVCWWAPARLVGGQRPHHLASRAGAAEALRPAPDVPDAATTTTSRGVHQPGRQQRAVPRPTPVG